MQNIVAQPLVEKPFTSRSSRLVGMKALRAPTTGRQALMDLLLGLLSSDLVSVEPESMAKILEGPVSSESVEGMSREWRYTLRNLIYQRLERSVGDGELPERADIEVLSCLCISFASGLITSLQDGISAESLTNAIDLFVESVGFHKVRTPKRRSRNASTTVASGLTLVKR